MPADPFQPSTLAPANRRLTGQAVFLIGRAMAVAIPPRIRGNFFLTLLVLLLLAPVIACAPPPTPLEPGFRELNLPFPDYPPAEPFLSYQSRLRAYEPPPPPPRYTAKNERIFREVEQLRVQSEAEIAYRQRLQAASDAHGQSGDTKAWAQYKQRLERSRLYAAEQEERYKLAARQQNDDRFSKFKGRLTRVEEEEARRKSLYEQRRRELLSKAYLQYLRTYSEITSKYGEDAP